MSRQKQQSTSRLQGKKAVAGQPAAPAAASGDFNPDRHRLRCDCSWRPVDWRWQRANLLLQTRERLGPGDDDAVQVILQFLREQRGQLDSSRAAISDDSKTRVQHACEIHHANRMPRWALESWLLSGEPVEVVGEQIGQEVELVRWYATVFFDLGDRITAPGFVTHEVIGPKLHDGLTVKDVDVLWKHFAYTMGPHALQAVIDDFVEAGRDDYSYLADGTFKNVRLPEIRRLIHQTIRVKLLPVDNVKAALQTFMDVLKSEPQQPTTIAIVQRLVVLVNLTALRSQDSMAKPGSHSVEPVELPSEEVEAQDAA